MDEHQQNLQDFDADLASMAPAQRAMFELAKASIYEIIKKFPGVGLMAVAYICADEASKIPDLPGATQ